MAPFSRLPLATLFIVAGAAARREYAPSSEILPSGFVPDEVHIPICGNVRCGTMTIDHAFDIPGVAFDRPLGQAYIAAETGCTTASITRSHVFTLLRECPELSLAVARLANAGTVAQ